MSFSPHTENEEASLCHRVRLRFQPDHRNYLLKYAQAERLLREVLHVYAQTLPPDHLTRSPAKRRNAAQLAHSGALWLPDWNRFGKELDAKLHALGGTRRKY